MSNSSNAPERLGEQLHNRAEEVLRPLLLSQGRDPQAYRADEYVRALEEATAEFEAATTNEALLVRAKEILAEEPKVDGFTLKGALLLARVEAELAAEPAEARAASASESKAMHERALEILAPILANQGRLPSDYTTDEYLLAAEQASKELGL